MWRNPHLYCACFIFVCVHSFHQWHLHLQACVVYFVHVIQICSWCHSLQWGSEHISFNQLQLYLCIYIFICSFIFTWQHWQLQNCLTQWPCWPRLWSIYTIWLKIEIIDNLIVLWKFYTHVPNNGKLTIIYQWYEGKFK